MVNSKAIIYLTAALFSLLVVSVACNWPQSSPTPDLASVVMQTQTAISIEHFLTSTSAVQIPEATSTAVIQATMLTPSPTISPSPTPTATTVSTCTDQAKFESETIPDGSEFTPGASFVKTWTLRNIGTCTWVPEYTLFFVEGEQMGGTSPSPIGQTVPPNNTIQLFLPQTAPQETGDHQGHWMLRNIAGANFGLGAKADVAFWVKISVTTDGVTGTGNANLGPPTWVDDFSGGGSNWYLGTDSEIDFEIDDGAMVMTALEPAGDQWRVAQRGYLSNFYLESKFVTGSACSGKDSYGTIVRAPDQTDGIIDSGYVFTFSCDGKYRIYRMDNGNYNGIINWTAFSGLKPGPNQTNIMGILADGDSLQLYANGALVSQISDNTYSTGLFGLVIRSEVTNNFQVFVEEIAYWNLP